MSYKEFKQKLDNISDDFNLRKKFPNYFNKWIFRITFILILVLGIYITYNNQINLKYSYFISCPETAKVQCENPLWVCNNVENLYTYSYNIDYARTCDEYKKYNIKCENDVCNKQFLQPGESIGHKPNLLYSNFGLIAFLIICGGLILNHIIYLIWGKKK